MTKAPRAIPSAVPHGPAIGRKVVPGMIKAPHPTAQPKDNAKAPKGERYGFRLLLSIMFSFSQSYIIMVSACSANDISCKSVF